MSEHVPVPAEHAPRKEQYLNKDGEVTVMEPNSKTAWITMDKEDTMGVRQ